MYATLGKSCPYGFPDPHRSNYCTQQEMETGYHTMSLSSKKFDIPQTVYDLPPNQGTRRFLDTPFSSPLLTPEEAKVIQNPNNASNR